MTDAMTNKIVIEGDVYWTPIHDQLEVNVRSKDIKKWVNVVDEIVVAFALQMYDNYPRLRITVERIESETNVTEQSS